MKIEMKNALYNALQEINTAYNNAAAIARAKAERAREKSKARQTARRLENSAIIEDFLTHPLRRSTEMVGRAIANIARIAEIVVACVLVYWFIKTNPEEAQNVWNAFCGFADMVGDAFFKVIGVFTDSINRVFSSL